MRAKVGRALGGLAACTAAVLASLIGHLALAALLTAEPTITVHDVSASGPYGG